MSFSFNLVREPFIPCVLADGSAVELGLEDVLRRAPAVREVRDGSPLVTVALLRLLLAVLHRNFGPENTGQWKRLWQAGRFDEAVLSDYWGRWQARFDLFDGKHPFYQTPGFREDDPSSVSRLAHEMASGNNATLFDHTRDADPPALSPAEAARLVIATQAFAVGGGQSSTGYTSHAPLLQGAAVLARGRTLFETLLLNLIACSAEEPMPAARDAPAWERDVSAPAQEPPTPAGYLDYLTWQNRTLALHPEAQDDRPVVRRVSYGQGRRLNAPGLTDPLMAYRRDDEGGWKPLRLRADRALWRDSGALFQLGAEGQARRPACFNWLARLVRDGVLTPAQRYNLSASGLCSDRAKVESWRYDSMPLPLALLNEEGLVAVLQQALVCAEEVARRLRRGVWLMAASLLSANGQQADADRIGPLVDSLAPERAYWSQLELPFRRFLLRLAEAPLEREQALARWAVEELGRRAWESFDRAAAGLGDSARALRAATLARRRLAGELGATLEPFKEALREPSR
jgi:CRISPR system Cascade subunit CasA